MLRSVWASLARRPATAAGFGMASAAASSSAAAAATPAPIVQHVRIRTRRRLRNAMIGAGVMYVCWTAYLSRVVLPPIMDHGLHDEDDDEGGVPIFLPFPFTFKVVESRPYKGTDPEWQAYIKIARDRELLMKIRNDMLETVRVAAEANPILTMRCGRNMQVRKHWLDLDFPYRPPPKIMRDGLLLTSDGIELATAEVDPVLMMRISRALWPAPVALSVSSFIKTLVMQNVQSVARFFGFEVWSPPSPTGPSPSLPSAFGAGASSVPPPLARPPPPAGDEVERLRAELKRLGINKESKPSASVPSLPGSTLPGPPGSSSPPSPSSSITPSPSSSSSSSSPSSPLNDIPRARDLIPFDSVRASIDGAWFDFKKKLAETWLPLRPQPPGGSIGVSGLVELQSANSRIMIEVVAFWNPKTRKYDAPTIHMKLRSIRPRNQVPL